MQCLINLVLFFPSHKSSGKHVTIFLQRSAARECCFRCGFKFDSLLKSGSGSWEGVPQ